MFFLRFSGEFGPKKSVHSPSFLKGVDGSLLDVFQLDIDRTSFLVGIKLFRFRLLVEGISSNLIMIEKLVPFF